ncbi:Baeyer-Villiger monooxygenase (plasmid) [Deinococcus aetherius]|uniref:Baeyer-Villiger monooxygenase n=1 Tax=Deinococcus aetherius TaxID=200252 RepID=A0ABM8AJ58_9DEIO|nr:NAD(P)/FAD-dependent oxidoreductase [Deinococcus aetherius]BDP43858.1 Baeyer-Villiger monooxygenase [Deinococcus aetherius]
MTTSESPAPHFEVAVIGTGFSGLGVAAGLKRAGITDFVVFERASDVGGTWRDNTYPGAACDTESNLYSFSFAPNPGWNHTYAPQPEILAYLRDTARRFGLLPHVRFQHAVRSAAWDDAEARWHIETSAGPFTARFLVSGHGPLAEPKWPDIPGLDTFPGPVFHSSRWRHDLDLTGKRVAVIGTGASAVQFVPEIAKQVGRLTVYQRSAPWIVPRLNRRVDARTQRLYRALPAAQLADRGRIAARRELLVLGFFDPGKERLVADVARAHLEAQVQDPELRAKLKPNYRVGCKRILVSDDYYPALTREGVELVTDPIREVRPEGVVTGDGTLREADAIVLGTGFHVAESPAARVFRGRDGRTLAEVWNGSPRAYRGTTVHGFPNLFLMVGPNTGLGHTSIVYMIEAQVAYLVSALCHLRREHLLALDVREDAQRAYNDRVQAELAKSVWVKGGCTSFYLDQHGQNVGLWPGFAFRYKAGLRRFDPGSYHFRLSPVPLGRSGVRAGAR